VPAPVPPPADPRQFTRVTPVLTRVTPFRQCARGYCAGTAWRAGVVPGSGRDRQLQYV